MTYADHKKAFLMRLNGKTYQQIGAAMCVTERRAKELVTLSKAFERCATKAEVGG